MTYQWGSPGPLASICAKPMATTRGRSPSPIPQFPLYWAKVSPGLLTKGHALSYSHGSPQVPLTTPPPFLFRPRVITWEMLTPPVFPTPPHYASLTLVGFLNSPFIKFYSLESAV